MERAKKRLFFFKKCISRENGANEEANFFFQIMKCNIDVISRWRKKNWWLQTKMEWRNKKNNKKNKKKLMPPKKWSSETLFLNKKFQSLWNRSGKSVIHKINLLWPWRSFYRPNAWDLQLPRYDSVFDRCAPQKYNHCYIYTLWQVSESLAITVL